MIDLSPSSIVLVYQSRLHKRQQDIRFGYGLVVLLLLLLFDFWLVGGLLFFGDDYNPSTN